MPEIRRGTALSGLPAVVKQNLEPYVKKTAPVALFPARIRPVYKALEIVHV